MARVAAEVARVMMVAVVAEAMGARVAHGKGHGCVNGRIAKRADDWIRNVWAAESKCDQRLAAA